MTFEELQELLAEQFSCDESDLAEDTEFAELGADHEDFIEMAWGLGEALGIDIREDDLAACPTVGALYRLLCDLTEEL